MPVPAEGAQFAVYKITKRRDEDITAALGAFRLTLAKDGTVGVDPHRLWRHGGDAEAGEGGRGGAARQAVDRGDGRGGDRRLSPSDFTPLTDMRASAEYRALAAQNLLRRFFAETQRQQGAGAGLAARRREAA